jgi:hypothetical protein
MCDLVSMKRRGIRCFNLSHQYGDEWWGFILPTEVAALGLHGGAMGERGGLPESGLACATVYSFQWFQAQMKAEVEGSLPRGIPQHVVAAQVVHDGRTEAHPSVVHELALMGERSQDRLKQMR